MRLRPELVVLDMDVPVFEVVVACVALGHCQASFRPGGFERLQFVRYFAYTGAGEDNVVASTAGHSCLPGFQVSAPQGLPEGQNPGIHARPQHAAVSALLVQCYPFRHRRPGLVLCLRREWFWEVAGPRQRFHQTRIGSRPAVLRFFHKAHAGAVTVYLPQEDGATVSYFVEAF